MTTANASKLRGSFTRGELTVHHDPAGRRPRSSNALRDVGRQVALVPTMGALHEGHLQLVRQAARARPAVVVVSIFVNPLQFGASEDLDRYPRTLDADLEVLRARGRRPGLRAQRRRHVPGRARAPRSHPGPLGARARGCEPARRTSPACSPWSRSCFQHRRRRDVAFFGEKDYQQLVLIRQMARDLDFGVEVVGVPDRARAGRPRPVLAQPLPRRGAAGGGGDAVRRAGRGRARRRRAVPTRCSTPPAQVLATRPGVELDYLELRAADLGPHPPQGPARLLIAARVGSTRLIDNIAGRPWAAIRSTTTPA